MANENILTRLRNKFKDELPENYERRIVFWRDEERNFEEDLNELEENGISGVKIIRLDGKNDFAVKKLLSHDDLTGNYLVYDPVFHENLNDDWLLDIKLYSEEFKADRMSLVMDDLNIEKTVKMQKTIKLYDKFFKKDKLVSKMKMVKGFYKREDEIHIAVLTILTDPNFSLSDSFIPEKYTANTQKILIRILSGGLSEENNKALKNIRKYGNMDVLKALLEKCTGYRPAVFDSLENETNNEECVSGNEPGTETETEDKNEESESKSKKIPQEKKIYIKRFASHVIVTGQFSKMDPSIFEGLNDYISVNSSDYQNTCFSILTEWNALDKRSFREICREVDLELNLPARFEKHDVDILKGNIILPSIHEIILKKLFMEISEGIIKEDLIIEIAGSYHSRHLSSDSADYLLPYYDCLFNIAKIDEFFRKYSTGFHFTTPQEAADFYVRSGYLMDTYYRHFCIKFKQIRNETPFTQDIRDIIEASAEHVHRIYKSRYLAEINDSWISTIKDDLKESGSVQGITRQRDFYKKYINYRSNSRSEKIFVIISDAFRYETAIELCEMIGKSDKIHGEISKEYMLSTFPSITKFGMAALLPGKTFTVEKIKQGLNVFIDQKPTESTENRQKILCDENEKSIAVTFKELNRMDRSSKRNLTNGKEVIYIYHNTIDAIGDKRETEDKTFDACDDAINELHDMINQIVSDMNGTNIFITSDHGFLYTEKPLDEIDKISLDNVSGSILESARRYVLAELGSVSEYLLPVSSDGISDNSKNNIEPIKGFAPNGAVRIKKAGGGEQFVHGGISLQEMIVPVIIFKNKRDLTKEERNKETKLELLSITRKITNMTFTLKFSQDVPVSENVRAGKYEVWFSDEKNDITIHESISAERKSAEAVERVYDVTFTLKPGNYSKSGKYYLNIMKKGSLTSDQIEFEINIFGSDDYGFDF